MSCSMDSREAVGLSPRRGGGIEGPPARMAKGASSAPLIVTLRFLGGMLAPSC